MKKHLLFFLTLAIFQSIFSFAQSPDHIVISQVYSGGGNSNAQYKNDFVELYNPTGNDVSLAGWSLQYAGATGSNWGSNNLALSGIIASGKYFLIQLSSGGNNGAALPAADQMATGSFNIAAEGGKVALINNTTPLSGLCPFNPQPNTSIVDFVGFGTDVTCFEGSGKGPTTSAISAVFRKSNGCIDNNDNKADFIELAPSPRNSAAPLHSCGTVISITGIAPQPVCVDAANGAPVTVNYTFTGSLPSSLTFYLSDATGSFGNKINVGATTVSQPSGIASVNIPAAVASSAKYHLRADAGNAYGEASAPLEIINGTKKVASVNAYPDQTEASVQWLVPSGCYEEFMVVCRQGGSVGGTPSGDGSAYVADPNFGGAGTAFGGGKVVYKGNGTSALVTGLTLGQTYYFKVFSHRGIHWSTGVEASATTRIIPAPGEVLINAFSTRYNTPGGEYYELVNTTGKTFNFADISFSYQDDQGDARQPTNLSGTLQPHSFWLLSRPDSATVSVGKTFALPKDGSSGAGVSDAGYIGLVRRKDSVIIDAVGFGKVSGGTLIEGTAADPVPGGAGGGIRRKQDGVDNNNNKTDFEVIPLSAIDLRNSTSRLANNGANVPAGTYARMYVTGNSTIAGNTTLSEKLVLAGGKLSLNNATLTVKAAEGGNTNSYVQTNGSGTLAANIIETSQFVFPVGNSTYNPLSIANGSGLRWQVRVADGVSALGGDRAVRRTWHIDPAALPTTGATLHFQYNAGDPAQLGNNFNSSEDVQVWQFHNSNWQKAGPVTTPAGNPQGIRTVTLSNWTQFSPFVIASASAILPVQFGAIQLYEREHHRVLEFTAHNELDIVRYDIEWSGNGTSFVVLDTLLPRNNRGGTETYTFSDHRPLAGTVYYRVRAVEQDGTILYSPVLTIAGRISLPLLRIAPTPVTGGTINYNIGSLPPGLYGIHVIDAAGRILLQRQLQHGGGMTAGTISLPYLQRGVYLLTVRGQVRMQQAFVVQ